MLASRTPGAFVCLRCESRLAQRRLPAFTRRTSHAQFSASARRRDGAEDLEAVSAAQESKLKITKVVKRLNKLKRHKGKLLRETSAPLGLQRLGDEADILVLKEVADRKADEPEEQPETTEPPEPVEVPDIVASLQQEQESQAVSADEIYEQIESLRPQNDAEPGEQHYIKQATFVKLKKLLMTGFTQHQLMAFFSVAKKIKRYQVNKGVLASIKKPKGESAIERSEWQPGTTKITQRLPGLDRYVKIKGYTKNVSKQLLVDRILRDAWKLELLEEIEAPGELEMFLKPWQIALLTIGESETMLEQIARTRRARLDIYKHDDVLRITADKSTAEYAANDIEEALQNTAFKQMNIGTYKALLAEGVVPEDEEPTLDLVFSQRDFDVVRTLTRTNIEKVDDTLLMIRGFDTASVEEARRTLVRFLPLKDLTKYTFDTQKGAAKNSSYLLPVFPEKTVDHKYREMKLGRMSLPIVRLTQPEPLDDQAKPAKKPEKQEPTKHAMQGLINRTTAAIRLKAPDRKQPEGGDGGWQLESEYKLSAEIGQVLFALSHEDPRKAIEAALERPSLPPFSPTFPGLASLLASPDLTATARLKTPSLMYDFIPEPEQANFEPGQQFPSLQIQMRTGRKGQPATLHKLTLGFQSRMHDVLLPDKAADIRFLRSTRLRYHRSHPGSRKDAALSTWLDAVISNISSGARLTAPPLRIEIPKWTIPGFPRDAKGTRSVTYHFSGVSFRQSVSGELLGEAVSYSTMQSGKLGQRGGRLAVHYGGWGDGNVGDEQGVRKWVERCLEVVERVGEAGREGRSLGRVVRPRHEGGRKERRERGEQKEGTPEEDGEEKNELDAREGETPIERQEEKTGQQERMTEVARDHASKEEKAQPGEQTEDKFPS